LGEGLSHVKINELTKRRVKVPEGIYATGYSNYSRYP